MDASQKKECFKLISENILSQQWKKVGKNLGLEEPDLNAIYADCRIRGEGAQEIYLQMLLKWEHKFPECVNFQFLYKALKDSDRADLAEKIVQVARGTKSNASNTASRKVSTNSSNNIKHQVDVSSSNNQDIRQRSSVSPRNTYSSVPQLNVPAAVIKDNSVVQEEIYTKEIIPESKAYYWQMVKNKMYLILIITVIVLCIYMYYGKHSAMEFLHGLGEALMTYGSLPAIGYVFGKLLCIW